MAGEKLIYGTLNAFLKTGDQFTTWLHKAFYEILIPEDYWAPELDGFRVVRMVPVGVLDRNEILLIPRLHRQMPISISWTMPIALAQKGLSCKVLRGSANCWTCQHRVGGTDLWGCHLAGELRPIGVREQYDRDLGGCPVYESATPGRITCFEIPTWWRDSDWPLCGHRYAAQAFDIEKLQRLVAGEDIEPPLRLMPIPPSPRECSGYPRPATPTKEGWLSFLANAFVGVTGLDEFLVEAKKKEFAAAPPRGFASGGI